MKIIQINATYGVGSTGKIARDISDKLIEDGHESYVMWATACKEDGRGAKLFRIGGWLDHKLHALLRRISGKQGWHSKLATKRACKTIEEIAPDVVHLHNLHSNYINLSYLLRFLAERDIPTLITLHDCWFLSGYCCHYKNYNCDGWQNGCKNCPAVSKRLVKQVEKAFSERDELYSSFKHLAVNGVSKWTSEAARKSMLGKASCIKYIYNWIDSDLFSPRANASDVRKKYGISEDKKIILGVSQLWAESKGLGVFTELAKTLSDRATVVLVGECKNSADIENLKCIGFTSSADELAELYSAADVLVNASSAETFGLVTVEAMACGTPVVAYDNTGSSEIVREGCGALVPDGDVDGIVAAVVNLLDNGKEMYSSSCRSHAVENFEKNTQVRKYIELYRTISSCDTAD